MADYTARSTVILNGKQAEDQLEKLNTRAAELREEMKKLRKANDMAGFDKKERELKQVNKEMAQMKKEAFSVETVLKNLSSASFKEISTAARKATNELKAMKQTDPGYAAKAGQAKLLNDKLREMGLLTRSQQSIWGRLGDGFNKYFGLITAAIASFTGIALTVKSSVNAFAEFDDKLSDVQKTTGLAKDQVKSLNSELEKLDTRTSQEGLLELARIAGKLGITAEKDVLAFVRAADKINVALSEDLGGNTEQAINDLGKLVDIFKLKDTYGIEDSLLKVGSAINSLGAAGTANEAYLVEFSKRIAGIAPSAGISIQKVLGLAATLDELGQTSEVSGTVVNNVIASMFKDTATYAKIAGVELSAFTNLLSTDANEAFIKVLEGAKGSGTGFAEMAVNLDQLGLDGARSTGVLAVLANNIDKLREKQAYSNAEFAKGTSIITEYNTKNENAQAKLEKARKGFAEIQRELGERLAPAYASVIHKGSLMLKTTGAIVEFMFKHGKALALATTAIVTYTIAINAHNIATRLYNSLTTAATVITKGFNVAVKTNPIGLLISLLTTVATGFILFSNKAGEAKKAQSEFNDVVKQGNDLLAGSKTLAERSAITKNLSKEQLASLKSDIEAQIKQEDDFHATLLQKAKKQLDEDAELAKINEQRKQANLTQIQKISLAAQANARATEITRELEEENKTNQQRLKNLKTHLSDVNTELKKRPVTPSEAPGDSTPATTTTPFTITQETDAPISNYAVEQAKKEAQILAEKKANEAEWTAFMKKQVEERMDASQEELAKEQENLEFEKQITEARQQLKSEYMNAIGQVAGALASMFEEGSAAQIAMIAIEKSAAIAQIIFQTAVANAKAVAMSPLTAGQPWVTINTISAAASIAGIVATTITSFKDKKNNNKPGYVAGKYPGLQTGMYGDKPHYALFNEVPGRPEMVIDGVTTRDIRLNYPEIEQAIYAIRDGRQPKGFADGKYPSSASPSALPSQPPIAIGAATSDPEIKQLIQLVVKMTKEIRENPPRLPIDQFERERKKYIDIQQNKGL